MVQKFRITYIHLFVICTVMLRIETLQVNVSADIICEDLNPYHILHNAQNISQNYYSPFEVKSNATHVEVGYTLIITVGSQFNYSFRGFIIQGKYRNLPCGKFEPKPDVTVIECKGRGPKTKFFDVSIHKSNIAIHLDDKPKTSFELIWHSPDYVLGPVDFYLSPIINESFFWVSELSYEVSSVMFDYNYHPELFISTTSIKPTPDLLEEIQYLD